MEDSEVASLGFAERGSVFWFMLAGSQVWLSFILTDQITGAVESLFGASAAALFLLAIVAFRKEQRDLLLNPLAIQKEVHEDQIKNQKTKNLLIMNIWMAVMIIGYFMFNH